MDTQFCLARTSLRVFIILLLTLGVAGFVYAQSQPEATVTDCATQTDIPQAECEALVALYNSTDGPNWIDNTGWNTNQSPCSWYQIACTDGRVTYLTPQGNGLAGSIPPELANLTEVWDIDLENNQLEGSIPPELGNLNNLFVLDLLGNQLTGSIPPELGNLSSLHYLLIGRNQLTGTIPPELGNLSNLEILNLGRNQLEGAIPPELGNLTNLESLELYANQLTGSIPASFGNLSHLYRLSLLQNQLSGPLPPELGNMVSLSWLQLSGNQIEGNIPATLGNLENLEIVDINCNHLTGTIPPEIGNWKTVRWLWLYDNQLSGPIPDTIGNLTTLEQLVLESNQLSGDIPRSLTNLVDVDVLSLSLNMLTASDPDVLAFLAEKNPYWYVTQTMPPPVIEADPSLDNNVEVSWPPLDTDPDNPDIGDIGYYEIGYRTESDGDYIIAGRTVDRNAAAYTLAGLETDQSYYLSVRVFTPAHEKNQNPMTSIWSSETLVTTGQNLSVDPRQGRPEISWPDDINSEWYHLYIGSVDYSVTLLDTWIEGKEYCADGVCSFIPSIDPVAGIYHAWMQSWGYGQYSTGGDSGYDGWSHVEFMLPNFAPEAVTGMTVTIADGQVTLGWDAPDHATWYNIWLGTGSPDWTPTAFVWLDADSLGCGAGGACRIAPFTLPADAYVWYVRSWGPGGFSTGGMVDAPGWSQGPELVLP